MNFFYVPQLVSNLRMVLTSIPDIGNLDDVAQLADKIMEVTKPSPSTATININFEVEQLCKEVAKLK